MKITYDEAKKKLQKGDWVYNQNGREVMILKTISDLEQLKRLRENGILQIDLFIKEFQVPEKAIAVSYEEAIELLSDYELIYYIDENGHEDEINSITELRRIYISLKLRVKQPVLYWYVE
ncbi:MAG: hypothetical protein ACLU84_09125 [Clostridia bacterium]